MPLNDCIAKLLDMEDVEIENVEHDSEKIVLSLHLKVRPHVCPTCGAVTTSVQDYRMQKVKDLPIQGKPVIWNYRKRRYRCTSCGKRFYEKNWLLPKWHRITNRTASYCLSLLGERRSAKDISKQIGVSASTVGRWMHLVNYGKPQKLPKVLSIDEFRGNTDGEKFQCILTSPEQRRIVDILPRRTQTEIFSYLRGFSNRSEVRYFVMDMNRVYFETAKTLFPNAKIVIDRFHVSRYCTWAVENVRKRIQANLPVHERKYFKRSRKLLPARKASLNDENRDAVSLMLSCSRDLANAYYLKESFYEFMDSADSEKAKQKLKEFLFKADVLNLDEFKPCTRMLRNWSEYILNSFDCRYTNGYTEGVNNSIKALKRIAYGYRNFDNFRTRILHIDRVKADPLKAP